VTLVAKKIVARKELHGNLVNTKITKDQDWNRESPLRKRMVILMVWYAPSHAF
jgi:hypothetical protein